jgi:hypothetical protein
VSCAAITRSAFGVAGDDCGPGLGSACDELASRRLHCGDKDELAMVPRMLVARHPWVIGEVSDCLRQRGEDSPL